ncbi:hypothetical protein [Chryseobacterium sp. G0201]|uniref:hypothetical protein n=1 Tax=Chryseobacterium sp. G0201 TaxID=2487065 RepID=UPI000F514E4B|nr:hypothetical protein [Chryseobacterium sp. G0201]AZA53411.1 hypothetical protein EG348_10520 [Chryseobacterium sp. G0201]
MSNFFDFIKKNALLIVLINIILTILAPWLFTRNSLFNWLNFRETGQIGDTIGGITAPFINILNAFLIYLAFTEQLNANKILQNQLDQEKAKEIRRLSEIKYIIIHDLEKNILPRLQLIEDEMIEYIFQTEQDQLITLDLHSTFNDNIFKSIKHSDLFNIFYSNFEDILQIYARVDYICKQLPINLSKRFPTDYDSLELINLTPEQYERIKKRHNEKKKMLLGAIPQTVIEPCKNDIIKVLSLYNDGKPFLLKKEQL